MRTEAEIKERIEDLKRSLDNVKPFSDDYFEICRCLDELEWVLENGGEIKNDF